MALLFSPSFAAFPFLYIHSFHNLVLSLDPLSYIYPSIFATGTIQRMRIMLQTAWDKMYM